MECVNTVWKAFFCFLFLVYAQGWFVNLYFMETSLFLL